MVLTVLMTWLVLTALTTVFVAAIGRSALREDEALGFVPDRCRVHELEGTADERVPLPAWSS